MEKMTSIMTDHSDGVKTISKLNIDPKQSNSKNILKAISFMQRKLTNDELADINLIRKAVHDFLGIISPKGIYKIKPAHRLNDVWKNVVFEYGICDTTDYSAPKFVYFNMSGKLPINKHGHSYSWRDKKSHEFKVYNGKRLLAAYLLWEKIAWGKAKTPELNDLKAYFINRHFIPRKPYWLEADKDAQLLEWIMDALQVDLNIELMTKYETSAKKEVATALQTKKHINKRIEAAMQKSKFLGQGFTFVEYDNDTDLEKITQLETEWRTTKEQLPDMTNTPDLRFRKLGKHKAWGLYSPFHNTICIDIRNVNSFVHEYGHLIDFKLKDTNLSMLPDFQPIIKSYRKEIHNQLGIDSYVTKKINYYLTPTEVFARAYELYMSDQLADSSFLKNREQYATLDEYKTFNDANRKQIKQFMRKHIRTNGSK